MMNDIKFRAWDNIQNVMFNFDIYNVPSYVGQTYLVGEKFERIYEIMQYTGLKDKNGVEIYEGDIVKVNYNVVPEVKIITYHNASFGIRDNEMGFVPLAIFERPSKKLIVIGNIYENPELLGDSQ